MNVRFAPSEIEQSIPARFARQCRIGPDRPAIVERHDACTYAELDTWSSAIAGAVLARTGGEPRPVPFLLPQSPLAVAVTLAILRSGHHYVPMDASWSAARIADLCRELAPACVVTDGEFAPLLRGAVGDAAVLELSHERPRSAPGLPEIRIAPADPAYIYFTSGSTGRPKGVIDCHRNVLHNVMRYTNALAIVPDDRLTLLQSCAFSGAVSSMFAALANGAAVLPIDMRRETPARMADWIEDAGATVYHSVPAIFRSLMSPGRTFRRLRVVRLEGDRATRLDLELFRAHVAPPCRVAVGLGATETGLVCQHFHDHTMPIPDGVVPIGYPVQDMQVAIRDAEGNAVAAGAAGEIVVRSRYLALGYWNDPAATARAFTDAGSGDGERSYRTGDLGRLAADGRLDYLGRLDGRVKLRGQWIDLADIDAAITALHGVREAVVAAVDDAEGTPRLVAWYVGAGPDAPNVSKLHRDLASCLPPHMLPARYVEMERLPLNDNGKVDRARLPRPPQTRPALTVAYAPPRDLVQQRLCELWEHALDVRPVGIDDDFFELGGDSLLAATMIDEVDALFGRGVTVSALLRAATIAHLAQAVAGDRREIDAPIVPIRASGTRAPLFFLHGDYHSGGLYCRELVRHLDASRPLYALPPCGYDGKPIPPSYGSAAKLHLAAIREVQPHGPYHLGGQCNGGLVALEVARQLRASGERVASLILLGASAQNIRFRMLHGIVEVGGRIVGVRAEARRYAFRRLRDYALNTGGVPAAARLRFTLRKLGVLRAEAARVARARHDRGDTPLDPGTAERHGYRERIRDHYVALDNAYVPAHYRGAATLLWPRDDPTPVAVEASAWRRVVAQLDVVEIPGNHNTCLTRHVSELGRAIQAALERGDAPAPTPRGLRVA